MRPDIIIKKDLDCRTQVDDYDQKRLGRAMLNCAISSRLRHKAEGDKQALVVKPQLLLELCKCHLDLQIAVKIQASEDELQNEFQKLLPSNSMKDEIDTAILRYEKQAVLRRLQYILEHPWLGFAINEDTRKLYHDLAKNDVLQRVIEQNIAFLERSYDKLHAYALLRLDSLQNSPSINCCAEELMNAYRRELTTDLAACEARKAEGVKAAFNNRDRIIMPSELSQLIVSGDNPFFKVLHQHVDTPNSTSDTKTIAAFKALPKFLNDHPNYCIADSESVINMARAISNPQERDKFLADNYHAFTQSQEFMTTLRKAVAELVNSEIQRFSREMLKPHDPEEQSILQGKLDALHQANNLLEVEKKRVDRVLEQILDKKNPELGKKLWQTRGSHETPEVISQFKELNSLQFKPGRAHLNDDGSIVFEKTNTRKVKNAAWTVLSKLNFLSPKAGNTAARTSEPAVASSGNRQ
jgi:hypothetical protein